MGHGKKKRRCYLPLWWIGTVNKKSRSKNKASSPTSKRRRKSQDVVKFKGELKDMRKLSSNDEAFCLSWNRLCEIISIIHSRKTPTPETYMRWNQHAISFYLKMCTCFGVDYQHLEAFTSEDDKEEEEEQETHIECAQPSTKKMSKSNEECLEQETHIDFAQPSTTEMSYEECLELEENVASYGMNQPSTEEMSYQELLEQEENTPWVSFAPCYLYGPFKFGSYSPEATPDRIPYHLYLLVKEAVDIMNTAKCRIALSRVEQKIYFFYTYLNCHLPTGWNYDSDNASALIACYDATRTPRYCMDNFTPIGDRVEILGFDPDVELSPEGMARVMSIIHSRKTPSFWKMHLQEISFYCKLCSCFGIDYHRLEAASEEDVCLMRVA